MAPAAEVVLDSSSGTLYFPWETLQLTDNVLANLTSLDLSNVSVFYFADGADNATSKLGLADGCKTSPRDISWPSSDIWNLFNILLGKSALIKTVPPAAVCYDNWGVYDEEACNWLTSNWANNSYYQLVEAGLGGKAVFLPKRLTS